MAKHIAMWRRFSRVALITGSVLLSVLSTAASGATTPSRQGFLPRADSASGNPFCGHLGLDYQASSGAWAFCFGAQSRGKFAPQRAAAAAIPRGTPANVNAANIAEDISPSGVRAYGQSSPSVAAAGQYVLEAWTDATGLFATCPSPMYKEELTSIGFSANGGSSFADLAGLPNSNCAQDVYGGDPSVVAYDVSGHIYFYVLSLYNSPTGLGPSDMALAACRATGTGRAAKIGCGQPTVVATSSACLATSGILYCNFLDKGFMSIDPVRGRLYISYSEFPYSGAGSEIQLAVCDLGRASGDRGPAGGRPAMPVCENGADTAPAIPYLTVAPSDPVGCENEGAYPAVDPATGAVYVGYEYNWGTNINGVAVPPCGGIPTKEVLTKVPLRCLPLTTTSPCTGPAVRTTVPVTSLAAAAIPGYDGAPNDFPRLAVSNPSGTVSMVWNDARYDPLGDILLQSFSLASLSRIQGRPVVVNRSRGGLHLLPALRVAGGSGGLDMSWFARASAMATSTNVWAAINVDPRTRTTPTANALITTAASNWGATSSDLTPDFGDYTDNDVLTTGKPPYVGRTLFIAWTDGRLGLPQPFSAHLPVG